MSYLISLLLAAPSCLMAQFVDLSSPGDGSVLYYALSPTLPNTSTTPIYKVGPAIPAMMVLGIARPVLSGLPIDGFSDATWLSPYYLASHPQFSRDGSVFAYTTSRVCTGNSTACTQYNLSRTIVQGVPGKSELTFEFDQAWLSGNGRYLLGHGSAFANLSDSVVDLETGQQSALSYAQGAASFSTSGRVIADNGAAAVPGQSSYSPAFDATIDAAGKSIVYVSYEPTSDPNPQRILRVFENSTHQDSLFLAENGDCYSPALSADGKRVFFLSTAQFGTGNPPGIPQLYTINLNYSDFRELTSFNEPSGVQSFTLSDDGQLVWYLSNDGALVSLNLNSTTQVFRPPAVNLAVTLVPGSIAPLERDWGPDVKATLDGTPLPAVLPEDTETSKPQLLTVSEGESTVQGWVTPIASSPRLVTDPIHQDWSSFVTETSPASPGEIVYFYGTGSGHPDATAASLSCTFTSHGDFTARPGLLSLAEAPGIPGYFQLTLQLPEVIPYNGPSLGVGQLGLNCNTGISASIYFVPSAATAAVHPVIN